MENIRTVMADMPISVKAYTIIDADGFYTVVLNQNHTHEQNLLSYKHELDHIINGDFEQRTRAGLIELYAHHI